MHGCSAGTRFGCGLALLMFSVCALVAPDPSRAAPQDDLAALKAFFKDRFPTIPVGDYGNGVYAFDDSLRQQWSEHEALGRDRMLPQ